LTAPILAVSLVMQEAGQRRQNIWYLVLWPD